MDNDWELVRQILRKYVDYWGIDSAKADQQVDNAIEQLQDKFILERREENV